MSSFQRNIRSRGAFWGWGFVSLIIFTILSPVIHLEDLAASLGSGNAILDLVLPSPKWKRLLISVYYVPSLKDPWPIIPLGISAVFLTWPLLFRRSFQIAAVASFCAWCPFLIHEWGSPWTGGDEVAAIYVGFLFAWLFVVFAYICRLFVKTEAWWMGALLVVVTTLIALIIAIVWTFEGPWAILHVDLFWIPPLLSLLMLAISLGSRLCPRIRSLRRQSED